MSLYVRKFVVLFLAISISELISAREVDEELEVVGQTPLGSSVAADRFPANIQSIDSADLAKQRALDLTEYMRRNLASVFVNEATSNPLQPDVQYRGFVGSPLLGLSQGLAVFQDGVRLNEPFGDTVNWVLIPDIAIRQLSLVPGSNPLFGLNALGGAISIATKDGATEPGTRAEIYAGSFDRVGLEFETGAAVNDRVDYYFAAQYFDEDGWRDFSPSEATRLFGNIGWHGQRSSIRATLTTADTDLVGNGAAPVELLAQERQAIFTRPDQTENELGMLNLIVEHETQSDVAMTGSLYFRASDIHSFNGDDSDFEVCDADARFICTSDDGDEELALDQDNNPVPNDPSLVGGTINRTRTIQDGVGLSFQASIDYLFGSYENALVVGLSYDSSDTAFSSSTQLGSLDPSRLVIPGDVFIGESFTRLDATTSNLGIFFSNTFGLGHNTELTFAGRFNNSDVQLRDQLGTALNGRHAFDRFNPSLGVSRRLSDRSSIYFSYSESSRAPSPVELSCADEDDPCLLPNAFLADPPLEQVIAETVEFGLRGRWTSEGNARTAQLHWQFGVFNTVNQDDIVFISAGALTNEGYFDNVGRTRRRGIELGVSGEQSSGSSWYANLTMLDATFREFISFPSAHNPAAINGEIFVTPGDRLPLVPKRLLKAGVRHDFGESVSFGAELVAGSGFHLRGDEANEVSEIGEYAVLSVAVEYRISELTQVYLKIDNALDQDYESFGLFGEPEGVLGDGFEDNRFISPAAPRAARLGVEIRF